MQTLSDRQQRTLKLVPRVVAQHLVNKWAAWSQGPAPPYDESNHASSTSANAPPEDQLPLCQEMGNYLSRKLSKKDRLDVAGGGQEQRLRASATGPGDGPPKVIIMSIRIKNFYDEYGAATARRHFDESAQIEAQVDLSDQLLQIVSGIIYESISQASHDGATKRPQDGSFAGDVIQFLGDQIIACLPGESPLMAATKAGDHRPGVSTGSRDNKISIRDEEDAAASQKDKAKKSSKKKKERQSAEKRGTVARKELWRLSQEETQKNMKNAITAAQKIHYFLSKMLKAHQAKEEEHGLASKSQVKEVQIGMGFGHCVLCHVGGVFGRTAFFAAGDALNEAQDSLKLAKVHQGIIVSKNLWRTFMRQGDGQEGSGSDDAHHDSSISSTKVHVDGYAKIDNAEENFEAFEQEKLLQEGMTAQEQKKRQASTHLNMLKKDILKLGKQQRDKLWPELQKYIPQYFRHYLDAAVAPGDQAEQIDLWKGNIKQGNHHRMLTIMVLSLELDGAFENEDSLLVLQTTIEIIQKQIYRMRGSLTKILYDTGGHVNEYSQSTTSSFDGGLQIVAEWGQPALNNQDNPARACLAAINIQKAVREFILSTNNATDNKSSIMMASNIENGESRLGRTASLMRHLHYESTSTLGSVATFTDVEAIELPIHIGIATGQVFQAIVGDDTSKSQRLDIALVGDAYNRAQNILSYAQQSFGKIYVDFATMSQARRFMDVRYVKHVEFPSHFFNTPIFEPLDTDPLDQFHINDQQSNVKAAFRSFEGDFIKQGSLIRAHHNPLILDYDCSYQLLNNKIYGRAQQVKALLQQIKKRVQASTESNQHNMSRLHQSQRSLDQQQKEAKGSQNQTQTGSISAIDMSRPPAGAAPHVYTIVIRAEKGMGKSLFSRNLLINLKQLEILLGQQMKQFGKGQQSANPRTSGKDSSSLEASSHSLLDPQNSKMNLKFKFCVSQCTPEMCLHFLGIWRPIMRTLLLTLASLLDKKPRKVLSQLVDKFSGLVGNKLLFIQEYFKIHDIDAKVLQNISANHVQQAIRPRTRFHEPRRFEDEFEDDVMTFFQMMIVETFEELEKMQTAEREKGVGYGLKTVIVFLLDDVSLMSEVDWKFFTYLTNDEENLCMKNLVIILNIDQAKTFVAPLRESAVSNLGLIISPNARKHYSQHIKPKENELFQHVVDLLPLTRDCTAQMLVNQSEIYAKQAMDEIDKLVQLEAAEGGDDGTNVPKMTASQAMDASFLKESKGKVVENQELLRSQLCRKYQVFIQYARISPTVLDYIDALCQGNPMTILSFFHCLLTRGFLEIRKDQTVEMADQLRYAREYGDKYSVSPQIQLPYEIFNSLSVFFDDRAQNVARLAATPQVVVACLYTVRACALVGTRFSTDLLLESGVCPPFFQQSQLQRISLFKILDLLEENDFIEMVHEEQVKKKGDTGGAAGRLNRFYRFNHTFLSTYVAQMMPFNEFKRRVHQILADYHRNYTHLDLVTDYKQSNDLKLLTRQYLELQKVLAPAKLDAQCQRSMLRKHVTLYIDGFKHKLTAAKAQGSRAAAPQDIVLLSTNVRAVSSAVDGYLSRKKARRLAKNSSKSSKPRDKQGAADKLTVECKFNIQLLAEVGGSEESFWLKVQDPEVLEVNTNKQIRAAQAFQETGESSYLDHSVTQLDGTVDSMADGLHAYHGLFEMIMQVDMQDIREIKDVGSAAEEDGLDLLEQLRMQERFDNGTSKKQTREKSTNKRKRGEGSRPPSASLEAAKDVVASNQQRFYLQVGYNTADGTPSVIYFQFSQEQERSRWYTYLNYLKERLQYQQFIQKFNDIPDIQLSQGRQHQLKNVPLHSERMSAAGVAAQVAERSQFTAGDEDATLKTKIAQAMKKGNHESQTRGASAIKELDEQILALQRSLGEAMHNRPERVRLEKEYDALLKKKEQLTKTKQKLQLMFAVGLNHFCTHIGVTPLREAYLPPSQAAQLSLRRVEPKIVKVHDGAYERLNLTYLADEDDDSQEARIGAADQPGPTPQVEEIKNSETTTLKTDTSREEAAMTDQQNEKDDYAEAPDDGQEALDDPDGRGAVLEPEMAEGVSGGDEYSAMGESLGEGVGAGLLSRQSNSNKASDTGVFVNAQAVEQTRDQPQLMPQGHQAGPTQPLPHHLRVLRRLAKERRYQELAQLKKNIDNTQNIYYEVAVAILPTVSLPLNGKILRDQRRRTIKTIIYPKVFKEGPSVSKFNTDEDEDERADFQQQLREEEEEAYRSRKSSNRLDDNAKIGPGGSSSINSFMDSREHEHGDLQEDLPRLAVRAPPRVNEGKQQYALRCQHAKKVFTDAEVAQFRLQRRKNTADTQFDVDLILGNRPAPYAGRSTGDTLAQQQELDAEMQRILAHAITKVLDQKSIRETAHNMNQLVVEAIEDQMQEHARQEERESQPRDAEAGSRRAPGRSATRTSGKDRQNGGQQQRELKDHARRASQRRLTIRASQKLIETLRDQDEQLRSRQSSERSLLKGGLGRSMSNKGFGLANEHGLRSQALLQNYIEQNLNATPGEHQVVARTLNDSADGNWNSQRSRGSRKQMQQMAQLLGASESRASLHPGGGRAPDRETMEGGESIDVLKNRELLNEQGRTALSRSRTAHESVPKQQVQPAGPGERAAMKGSMVPVLAKEGLQEQIESRYQPRLSAPTLRERHLGTMLSQRQLLLSEQYSLPIQEQDAEHDDGDQSADDEEVIVSSHHELAEDADDPMADQRSNVPHPSERKVKQKIGSSVPSETESLLERAERKQRAYMEGTYNRKQLQNELDHDRSQASRD